MVTVQSAPTTLVRGFDVWSPLDAQHIQAAVSAGYTFCARYVDNLSTSEISEIVGANLSLVLVKAAPPTGSYSATNGTTDGQSAAALARNLAVPSGACLFSDLEDVSENTPSDVMAYSNNWSRAVSAAGYVPGLYVGTSMFTGSQLYYDFAYEHYWMGGVEGLPFVTTRGYQLYQSGQTQIAGLTVDLDFAYTDLLGGQLAWLVG